MRRGLRRRSRLGGRRGRGLDGGVASAASAGCVHGRGKWIGTSQITTSFTQTVDSDTMGKVSYVAIKHYNAPNDAYTDIQAWLNGAQQSFNAVASIAKNISSL